MKKYLGSIAMLSLAVLLSAPAVSAAALTGHELSSEAKIDLVQARAIALKAHPGTIVAEELEREAGGSGLRYSFDIKQGGHIYEVGVDAKTGSVLENTREGSNPD